MDLSHIETKVILAKDLEDMRSALLDLIVEIEKYGRDLEWILLQWQLRSSYSIK